jgi:hypothetical protein
MTRALVVAESGDAARGQVELVHAVLTSAAAGSSGPCSGVAALVRGYGGFATRRC